MKLTRTFAFDSEEEREQFICGVNDTVLEFISNTPVTFEKTNENNMFYAELPETYSDIVFGISISLFHV